MCGDGGPAAVPTSTYTGPSPPATYSNSRIDLGATSLNNQVFQVDPRNPGPRTAGLIQDEATIDQFSAPKKGKDGRNLIGGPQVGGRRRGGPQPARATPRAPQGFPNIPGLTKRLGDLLAGKKAEEEGRSLNSRPVLKRLYKREADGQEMADIDMSGILQVTLATVAPPRNLPTALHLSHTRCSLPETLPSPWAPATTASWSPTRQSGTPTTSACPSPASWVASSCS